MTKKLVLTDFAQNMRFVYKMIKPFAAINAEETPGTTASAQTMCQLLRG